MLTPFLQLAGLSKKWPTFTAEEIEKHNTRSSLWIVAGDSVYDVTKLLGDHPGGDGALLRRGGGTKDCSEDFRFHGRAARQDAEKYKIGIVDPKTKLDHAAIASRRAAAAAQASLAAAAATRSCSGSAADMGHPILGIAKTRPDGEAMFPSNSTMAVSGGSHSHDLSLFNSATQQCTATCADMSNVVGGGGGPTHEVSVLITATPDSAKHDELPHPFIVSPNQEACYIHGKRSNSILLTPSGSEAGSFEREADVPGPDGTMVHQ